MKKTLLIMTLFAYGLAISVCYGDTTHTVEWYKENKDALVKKLIECENNSDKKNNTPNCINAKMADSQIIKSKEIVLDGLNLSAGLKISMIDYYLNHNKWPENNSSAGVAPPEDISGHGIASITISNNTIRIVYTDPVTTDTENNDIIFTGEETHKGVSFRFNCNGGRLPNELRPEECQIH